MRPQQLFLTVSGFTRMSNLARRRGPAANASFRIAHRADDVRCALGLVHKAYTRSGLIDPNPHGMRVLPHHLLETSEIFVGLVGPTIVSTVTLIRDGDLDIPMASIYPEQVEERRARGRHVAEVSCLADRRSDLSGAMHMMIGIMSLMAQCAVRRGVNELMIAVHPRHVGFYRRFIGFDVVGGEKSYGAVRDNPAIALSLNLDTLQVDNPKAYRRFFGRAFSEEELRYRSYERELTSELHDLLSPRSASRPPLNGNRKLMASDQLGNATTSFDSCPQ